MIHIEHISKEFDVDGLTLQTLQDISFDVEVGEFLSIVGPSGCGKSTLLRIVAGLQKPTSGNVTWETKPEIGFVFQNFALFPYLTVHQNIEFGLKMEGMKKKKRTEIVKERIEEVGLSGFGDKHPKELSGGMKQRVGIARALAIEPNVLILDEPFSSLDEFTAENLRQLLLDIWKKRNITVVMVTHLVTEALELSDRIIAMASTPGTVKHILENTLPRPRNLRSEKFYDMEDALKKSMKL